MTGKKVVVKDSKNTDPNKGWFARAHFWLTIAGGTYVLFVLSLAVPVIQRNAIFMHHVNYPFNAAFDTPEQYGLAPYKARNLQLTTSDGETLGAWHLLPSSVYHAATSDSYPPLTAFSQDTYDTALLSRPTVLFFHGNAGNRALSRRVQMASSLSSNLNLNVLSLDYRGFGDSSGTPSEAGLIADARAAWDWVYARNGGDASKIGIVGQSMGTGVGSALVGQLAGEGIHPPLLALLSPYSSLPTLLQTYSLFRTLPILSPLRAIPYAQSFLTSPRILRTQFDSLTTLSVLHTTTTTSIVLVHAQDDGEIPFSHSRAIFTALLNKELGLGEEDVISPGGMSIEAIEQHRKGLEERGRMEAEVVRTTKVEGWGVVKKLGRKAGDGQVVWLETKRGGHDDVGGSEGAVSLIGSVWDAKVREKGEGKVIFV